MRPNPSDCCLSEEAECCPECWTVEIPGDCTISGTWIVQKVDETESGCQYMQDANPQVIMLITKSPIPQIVLTFAITHGDGSPVWVKTGGACASSHELSLSLPTPGGLGCDTPENVEIIAIPVCPFLI